MPPHPNTNTQAMKRHHLLLAAASLLILGTAAAQNQVDNQGRRQGHWMRTDKDGSKIFEGEFVDGLETGTFTYYYPDGTIRIRNTFTTPGRICTHEAYDEQGRLLARGTYNQRNRHGQWQFFATDGHLVKEATYNMGVKEGLHVIYTPSGDTAESTHWLNGHRHGRWWKRLIGQGYITATYNNGGVEGTLVEYDDQGHLARRSLYHNGFKHGLTQRFEADTLTVEETWHNGTLTDRRIRLLTPNPQFISVLDIVCLTPKGKSKTLLFLRDGTTLEALEPSETIYDRLGTEFFVSANRKNRVMVDFHSVQAASTDSEGRDILILEPQPPFPIYLDEDGLKMVRSRQYQDHSPLDQMLDQTN